MVRAMVQTMFDLPGGTASSSIGEDENLKLNLNILAVPYMSSDKGVSEVDGSCLLDVLYNQPTCLSSFYNNSGYSDIRHVTSTFWVVGAQSETQRHVRESKLIGGTNIAQMLCCKVILRFPRNTKGSTNDASLARQKGERGRKTP